MIETSQEFKDIVNSNVRAKCEPIIKVLDDNGNDFLVWKAKDIKSLKYTRSIDILGREIPSMELTWTEVYGGKLNEQNFPEKYNNVAKYMVVELSFVQEYKNVATWKDVFESGATWKEIFATKTWRTLRNSPKTETITLPKMFLSARPTISGQTITWKAVDLLSFLTQTQTKGWFDYQLSIPFENPMIYSIINTRSAFSNVPSVFNGINKAIENMKDLLGKGIVKENQFNKIITTSAVNDFLVDYCAMRNLHIDFKDDYFVVKKHQKTAPVYDFTGRTLKAYPTVTINPAISEYRFNAYVWRENTLEDYFVPAESQYIYEAVAETNRYSYNGYGVSQFGGFGAYGTFREVDYSLSVSTGGDADVTPVDYLAEEQTIVNKGVRGDTYTEDNPVFPYRANDKPYPLEDDPVYKNNATRRFEFLTDYFSPNSASLEFDALPNVALETGDIISVLTNLYDGEERITKNAVIVGMEISYSGATMTKIKAHEVVL